MPPIGQGKNIGFGSKGPVKITVVISGPGMTAGRSARKKGAKKKGAKKKGAKKKVGKKKGGK